MDVAKVARDYFLSSQSNLLIPNRDYGARKLIHVGLGRSNSAGNVLKHNNNSNINKSHHREEDSDASEFSKRAGFFSNSKAKQRSLSGVPEENGGKEYHWRTVSCSGNTADAPSLDPDIAEEYPSSFSSSPSFPSYSQRPAENIRAGTHETESSPRNTVDSRRTSFGTVRSSSLSALSSSSTLSSPSSSSSYTPRPRPSSTSSSSGNSGGFGNFKGLLGSNNSSNPGIREKTLAMKSASTDNGGTDTMIELTDFRAPSNSLKILITFVVCVSNSFALTQGDHTRFGY
ncbi:hypothetical protein ElyMa_001727700 [Elysia marginata]|uniref:Uncharacterized protein n=1 Tax=Elysia marginata TaxID=1093978 RepID=A0AAV4JV97_9GAST|nr:hypothetical protein ElyMa_001727700 [Elysia marginata]